VLPSIIGAELTFHNYFGDGMVLQSNAINKVWGYGSLTNEEVVAHCEETNGYRSKSSFTPYQVNENIWEVVLDPQESKTVCMIEMTNTNLMLSNVVFGDVWLCSGQSNMEMNMDHIENSAEEIESSAIFGDRIRFTTIAHQWLNVSDDNHNVDLKLAWTTADDSASLRFMSAVCFLFAREIADKVNVPLGMVHSSWGGTPIEAWSDKAALDRCEVPAHWGGPDHMQTSNSYLWNGMINPIKRTSVKGFLWYQGEANTNRNRDLYNCTFPVLIDDWRNQFSANSGTSKTAPFGFVQLSTNKNPESEANGFPVIRWHQTQDVGYVPHAGMPNVFMSVALDTYDEADGYPGGIHPRYKQVVAQRLAVAGLHVAYQMEEYPTGGPFPEYFEPQESSIRVIYSTNFTYNENAEITGFYYCDESPEKCDEGNNLSLWVSFPKSAVQQVSPSVLELVTAPFQGTVGYLWRTDPVLTLYGLPIYSDDEFHLPSPPWKISMEDIWGNLS